MKTSLRSGLSWGHRSKLQNCQSPIVQQAHLPVVPALNLALSLCAAQGKRVCSLEVAYMGLKAYGSLLHFVVAGSNLICAKPLAMLAVIEPDQFVVKSVI